MGKSKKIILGLMLILLGAITYNGFWLKKQFALIDKSDLYWEFDKKEALASFTHIRIDGGNMIYLNIVDGIENKLFSKSEPVTDFTFTISNDTLNLKFAPELFTKRIAGKRWRNYRIVVGCAHLKSVVLNDSYSDMELKSSDSLTIETNGFSILKVKSSNAEIKSLNLKLSGNSVIFFSDDKNPLQTDFLNVQLLDSSFVNLNKTVAKSFVPTLKDNARIYYGSGIKTHQNDDTGMDNTSGN